MLCLAMPIALIIIKLTILVFEINTNKFIITLITYLFFLLYLYFLILSKKICIIFYLIIRLPNLVTIISTVERFISKLIIMYSIS